MKIIYIIFGLIIAIVLLEFVKHHFLKKTSKLIMFGFIILVIFLSFSYTFKDVDDFKDNSIIQTGAVITGGIITIFNENVDTEAIINSTVKSNKLFKS